MNHVRGAHITDAARVKRLSCILRRLAAGAALLLGLGLMGIGAPAAQAGTDPIGVHSMLQVNSPYSLMQQMFSEASDLHAGAIRLDVAPALIFLHGPDDPDFSGLDEIMGLAARYHVRVSADLLTIPPWLANCASAMEATPRCGTDDLAGYGSVVSQIIRHAEPVIHDWEIWNEPDSGEFFTGTPAQYAGMLRTAHDAIKQADPAANVILGGISSPAGMGWLAEVFATPGFDALHAFDTANVHERSSLDALLPEIVSWRSFFAEQGFSGPLWVTEHGYPADPGFQYDPSYAAGPASQAAYLTASVPTLLEAGASEVFVTERDNLGGQFASEGILSGGAADGLDTPLAQRPAYGAVHAIANCYRLLGRDCPGAPAVATPSALVLPASRIGSSTAATVTVSDSGSAPLVLGPAALAPGGSPAIILQPNACPAILEPNQTCTIGLGFAPTTGGTQTTSLQVGSDNGPLTVAVSAASPSVASLTSPQPVTRRFAALRHADGVGYPQLLTLNLSNPMPVAVRISRLALSGEDPHQFRVQGRACTQAALGPGAACAITVLFEPSRVGTAHAELSVGGNGQPLQLALQATAYALPSVQVLSATGAAACFSSGSANRVLVATDEPATISWQVVRSRRPATAGCAGVRSAGARFNASGRSASSGTVATGARRTPIGDRRGFVARFGLPVGNGTQGLRPGPYELTVTASNGHGLSRSRTMMVTVAG